MESQDHSNGPAHGAEEAPLQRHLPTTWRVWFVRVRLVLGACLAVPVTAVFLLGEFAKFAPLARNNAVGELLSHAEIACQLRVPFGQAVLVSVAWPLLLGLWRTTGLVLLIGLVCIWPQVSLRATDQANEAIVAVQPDASLRIVAANVLWTNGQMDRVFDALLAEEPDVIALIEVSKHWRNAALARLQVDFPFVAEGLNEDGWSESAWGQMIFSRLPALSTRAPELRLDGRRLRPFVEAVLEWEDSTLTVQAIHARRPGDRSRLRARVTLFDQLAGAAPRAQGERILVGDFNTTASSPLFGRLKSQAGLRDSRVGFGRLPSYTPHYAPISRRLPRGWTPAVTLDHALVSDGLDVTDRSTFDLPGSDHLGIVVSVTKASE